MGFKKLKQHKYFKYLLNPYIATLVAFVVWMLFFDDNSFLFHQELNTIIDEKENEIERYQKEIENDKKTTKYLSNPQNLENFARETYYLKKENEEIYIIERQDQAKHE